MVKTILIIDDEEDNRTTVKTVLTKEGYNVLVARNADEGYKKWVKYRPDLILMDIMMPGTPVKEVIPKMKGAKILYFSVVRVSEAEKEDLMKSKNVIGFIQKPFDLDELIKKVKKVIKS